VLGLLSGEVILEGKRQWCCRIHSKRQEDFEIRIQEKESQSRMLQTWKVVCWRGGKQCKIYGGLKMLLPF